MCLEDANGKKSRRGLEARFGAYNKLIELR